MHAEGRRAGPGPTGGWDYSSRGPGNGIVHAENLCMIYIAGGARNLGRAFRMQSHNLNYREGGRPCICMHHQLYSIRQGLLSIKKGGRPTILI